jgi:TRAP-type C4-dicarboxylate transport system permease small subunit
MIMLIIGFAASMGWLMAIEQIPQDMARAIPGLIDTPLLFLLAVMIAVLLLGCFIDGVTIKLLLVPILLPLVDAYAIDRVHFGIVLQMSLILGLATPPLGLGLFIVARLSGAPFEDIVAGSAALFHSASDRAGDPRHGADGVALVADNAAGPGMSGQESGTKRDRPRARDLAAPLRVVAAAAFLCVILLTIAQVFFRFALDAPLIWSEELSRLLIVWITFIGAAVVCWDGRHLNVDVGFELLPMAVRRVVRVFNAIIACGFLAMLVSPTLRLVKIENFSELGATELPSGIVRLPVAIGAVLMIAAIVLRLVYRRRGMAPDDPRLEKDAM